MDTKINEPVKYLIILWQVEKVTSECGNQVFLAPSQEMGPIQFQLEDLVLLKTMEWKVSFWSVAYQMEGGLSSTS